MSNDGVWLKVKLPYSLNVALRSAAMANKETLGGFVVRLLSGCMGGPEKWNPVRGAEPLITKPSDAKVVEGRTAGATPATGAEEFPGNPLLANIPIGGKRKVL